MALSQEILRAVRRYGPSVDAVARRYRNPVTGRRLSGEALLAKLITGESGGRTDAVSSAGARGLTQFMPGTRKAILDRTGGKVDPYRSVDDAVEAAGIHLRGELGHRQGLEGYNPGGGQGYVSYILGQKVGPVGRGGGSRGGGGTTQGASLSDVSQPGMPQPGSSAGVASLLAGLVGQKPQVVSSGVPEPVGGASQYLRMAGETPVSSGPPQPRSSVTDNLGALSQLLGDSLEVPEADAQTGSQGTPGVGSSRQGGAGGVSLKPSGGYRGAKGPADQLAAIGTGLGLKVMSTKRNNTNPHSGSRSDHDHGNRDAYAYDLSNGSRPTPEMDRAAFRIMRALGFKDYKMGEPIDTSRGVRTVNGMRVQVIYRGAGERFGGNHLNHIHVGVKRVR